MTRIPYDQDQELTASAYQGEKFCITCAHRRWRTIGGRDISTCHAPSNIVGKNAVTGRHVLIMASCWDQRAGMQGCTLLGNWWEQKHDVQRALDNKAQAPSTTLSNRSLAALKKITADEL